MLGYLPQEFGLYPRITAESLLNHLARLKGIIGGGERREIVSSLLHKTNLWIHRKKYLGGFSGGMKQRFGIAQALLADPQLIIVDEPTAGLDPTERNRFLNLLSEIGEKTIVILSTHIVEDVQELCSHMAIINGGRVLYRGRPDDAIKKLSGQIWMKRIRKIELPEYRANFFVLSEKLMGGVPEIHVMSESQPDGFESIQVGLEHVYFSHIALNVTKNELAA